MKKNNTYSIYLPDQIEQACQDYLKWYRSKQDAELSRPYGISNLIQEALLHYFESILPLIDRTNHDSK